jgi:hypothetical protein
MSFSRTFAVAAITIAAIVMTGCYEEPDLQLHEPGKYRGATDPLLKVAGTPEQDKRLASRFLAVQTDR